MAEPIQHLRPLNVAADAMPGAPVLRVAFWTLGCRLNQYDTESIRTTLSRRYAVRTVSWHEAADVYILNSCTVTSKADQECRRLARQAKRRHPQAKVIVAGCYAQNQPEALAAVPEIDGVVGNTRKGDVAEWLPRILANDAQLISVGPYDKHETFTSPLIDEFTDRSRAFVKIQDGCDLRCTYCTIWQARGPGRSRSVDDVLRQLEVLVEHGYRETILAGIHLGGYGRDLAPRVPLTDLLGRCLDAFPELRIRLSSIHPNEVTPELLDLFRDNRRMRPHLHISLQSGSDGVLKRMKRPYRAQRAWRALADVAAARKNFGIGADLIVGFPGETDEEFQETYDMVAQSPFSYLHVFRFSPRPGTPAATMSGAVHPETITARSAALRELAEQKQAAFRDALVGQTREAVVEAESARPGWKHATTDNYASVLVPDRFATGALVDVHIEASAEDGLIGTPRDAAPAPGEGV